MTMPKSDNPTYVFAHKSDFNETQTGEWRDVTRPELIGMKDKWAQLDIATAEDETLLQAIEEMAVAEGYYCERRLPSALCHTTADSSSSVRRDLQRISHLRRRQVNRRPPTVLP